MTVGFTAQFRSSGRVAETLAAGVLTTDGVDWIVEASGEADGVVVEDADGDPAIDEEAAAGLELIRTPIEVLAV